MEALGTHPEVRELQRTMRDLVALSAMPAAWVGRGLKEITEGCLDVLTGVLDISAAFVRLRDVDNGEESEAVYDPEHTAFADWVREQEVTRRTDTTKQNSELRSSGPQRASSFPAHRPELCIWPDGDRVLPVPISHLNPKCSWLQWLQITRPRHSEPLCLREEAEVERRRLKELLAQAPAAIALLNGPEHHWTYVNDLYVRVTGRKSAKDFLGKTLHGALPELEGQGFIELLDRVYATGEPFIGREMKATLNRSADSGPEDAYFNFVYQPILNRAGTVDGILIHAVEVTDQVLARKQIEISEGRLRLAQAAAHVGTWEWDPVQDTRFLSDELRDIFGYEKNDPNSIETWASRVAPDDFQRFAN